MLYHLIRLLAVLSLERFYNKIVVANRERVAENRPTIFVANHPNTMIDALVVGYASHKRVRIVAKSGLFQNKFASWFLTKVGLIPIHRRQDDPSQMDQNVAIFGRLYEHLESGGSVLLFPEGVSEPGRKLQRIKTGAARIALGAEEKNDFDLGVQIVPVGLNYSDIQKFRSDVYCRFGKPVLPGDYRQQYQDDPVQVVRDLTETIRSGLEKVVALVGEDSLENLVSSLQTIYKQELMTDLGLDERSQTDDFFVTKALIDAARWFTKHDPDRMEKLSTEMRKYLGNLHRLRLRDEFLNPRKKGIGFFRRLKAWLFLLVGLPIYLWGVINNIVPFLIPRLITDRFIRQETFVSSVKLLAGVGSFLFFYAVQSWVVWSVTETTWMTGLYAVALIPAGNFALYYMRKAGNYRQHLVFLSLFYRRKLVIYNLIQQRMRLIDSLNHAKETYLSRAEDVSRSAQEDWNGRSRPGTPIRS